MPHRRSTAAVELLPALNNSLADIPPAELDGEWLAAWQKRNNFTNEGAAARLALSLSSYYRQKTGPLTDQQANDFASSLHRSSPPQLSRYCRAGF
jgi:hypothetical protein